MVHILYLADIETAFHFKVPEQYEVTTSILAGSRAREIEHIPVITYGK